LNAMHVGARLLTLLEGRVAFGRASIPVWSQFCDRLRIVADGVNRRRQEDTEVPNPLPDIAG